jgi:hypothetical protein
MDGEFNARVCSADIYIEDHGCLTSVIRLDFNGFNGGFGTYLFDYNPDGKKWIPTSNMAIFVRRVLEIFEVDYWRDLKGKPCRIRIEDGIITAIGHFINDEWFCPREEFIKNDRGVD